MRLRTFIPLFLVALCLSSCASLARVKSPDPFDQVLNEARVSVLDVDSGQPTPLPALGQLEVTSPRPRQAASVTAQRVVEVGAVVAAAAVPIIASTAAGAATGGLLGGILAGLKAAALNPYTWGYVLTFVVIPLVFYVLRRRKVRITPELAAKLQQVRDKAIAEARLRAKDTRTPIDDILTEALDKAFEETIGLAR
jgi:predicted lipid-binding transport protein (Tim44 family)